METEEKEKKPIPKRLYVSCPACGAILMQVEAAYNILIKCPKCKNMITIDIERNKVITLAHVAVEKE